MSCAAARAVSSGHAYFSPAISKMLVDDYVAEIRRRGVEDSYGLLSLREKEVLQLLVSGKNNREIAELIPTSAVATVENASQQHPQESCTFTAFRSWFSTPCARV